MGDIADMILDGILSGDGEYIGETLGFPRSALREQGRKPLTRFHCQECARRFRSPAALADHVTAKHTKAALVVAAAANLLEALKPFAQIAAHDIDETETDADFFRAISSANNRAPQLLVGDFRRALAAVAKATGEAAA